MKNRLCVWLTAGLLALSLAGCGGNGQAAPEASEASGSAKSTETEALASEAEAQTSAAESEAAPEETEGGDAEEAAGQPTPVQKEINQTITDEELGYTITVKQAIIDIPFDDPSVWYDGYRTGVCVEVELKNDSEYTGGVFATDMSLLVNGEPVTTSLGRISTFQTYADENGLTSFDSSGVMQGESASGWLFYYFETGDGDNELGMRYSRPETEITVIGGQDGGTSSILPAQDFDITF